MQDLLIDTTDLLKPDTLDVVSAKRRQLEAIIDDLLKLKPGPERWEQALKLYIGFNLSATQGLTAAEEVYYTVKENASERAEQKNKFGTSGTPDENLRYQMNMPAGFKTFLNLVDPQINAKGNIPLIRKTFPQFVVAEAY